VNPLQNELNSKIWGHVPRRIIAFEPSASSMIIKISFQRGDKAPKLNKGKYHASINNGRNLQDKPLKLNLGCGKNIKPKSEGWINLDRIKLADVDVVHDLNKFPYPFADNTFEEIYGSNILEHLDDLMRVMEELHRISKPNAKIVICVPYYHSEGAFRDPTHKQFFHYLTFDYFTEGMPLSYYSKARFEIIKKRTLPTFRIFKLIPDILRVPLSYFIPNLISFLIFELRVIK